MRDKRLNWTEAVWLLPARGDCFHTGHLAEHGVQCAQRLIEQLGREVLHDLAAHLGDDFLHGLHLGLARWRELYPLDAAVCIIQPRYPALRLQTINQAHYGRTIQRQGLCQIFLPHGTLAALQMHQRQP